MKDSRKRSKREASRSDAHLWGGALLIGIGIWSLLVALDVPWADMQRLWPLALVGGGIASLVSALRAQPNEPGGVWFGVTAILSGGLFLYVTIPDPARWQALGQLWPLFVAFAGLGWIGAWMADALQTAPLVMGIVAIAFGVIFHLAQAGLVAWNPWILLRRWWPLVLVALGVALLVQAFIRREP